VSATPEVYIKVFAVVLTASPHTNPGLPVNEGQIVGGSSPGPHFVCFCAPDEVLLLVRSIYFPQTLMISHILYLPASLCPQYLHSTCSATEQTASFSLERAIPTPFSAVFPLSPPSFTHAILRKWVQSYDLALAPM
jgi:hypothetical protein